MLERKEKKKNKSTKYSTVAMGNPTYDETNDSDEDEMNNNTAS